MNKIEDFDKYIFLEEATSTNDICKSLGEIEDLKSALVNADYQSAGRGTSGRKWTMSKGKNLIFSIMLKPEMTVERVSGLTMLMAVAIVNILNKFDDYFRIKWPNDIVYNGKKVCGILTEVSSKNNKVNYVVIGAGINCNEKDFPIEISDKAISLEMILDHSINKNKLLREIIEEFLSLYNGYLYNGIESIIENIRKYSAVIGKNADVIIDNSKVRCRILDISDKGELVVEYEDKNTIDNLASAQIFVDGIYNYVIK